MRCLYTITTVSIKQNCRFEIECKIELNEKRLQTSSKFLTWYLTWIFLKRLDLRLDRDLTLGLDLLQMIWFVTSFERLCWDWIWIFSNNVRLDFDLSQLTWGLTWGLLLNDCRISWRISLRVGLLSANLSWMSWDLILSYLQTLETCSQILRLDLWLSPLKLSLANLRFKTQDWTCPIRLKNSSC